MVSRKISRKILSLILELCNALDTKKIFKTIYYHLYCYRLRGVREQGLHLGGGQTRIEGFLNVDASWLARSDVVANIEKLKFDNSTVNEIYTSHVFEHIPRAKASSVLNEWYRVLKAGGRLYISVPDFEHLISVYQDNLKYYEDQDSHDLVNKVSGIIFGGQLNKYDYHYMGYSYTTLKHLLEKIGFRDVKLYTESDLNFRNPSPALSVSICGKNLSLNIVGTKC